MEPITQRGLRRRSAVQKLESWKEIATPPPGFHDRQRGRNSRGMRSNGQADRQARPSLQHELDVWPAVVNASRRPARNCRPIGAAPDWGAGMGGLDICLARAMPRQRQW